MNSFEFLDALVLLGFFGALLSIGFYIKRLPKNDAENFLLSGRNLSLPFFIFTNVSTWYGGILGVGEFSFKYGIVSWFTQGLPYYLFAVVFALFFAKKIRDAALITIPDKLKQTFGESSGIIGGALILLLVSPAPYILMIAFIINYLFGVPIWMGLLLALFISVSYLIKGGYKSDVYTDIFLFFVMFIGFAITLYFLYSTFGGKEFLSENIPQKHFSMSGDLNAVEIFVWYLIALWTLADPGFHQRTNAAKNSSVAVKGILLSIPLWFLFDFLTTSVGLYSRALNPDLANPVMAYPAMAMNYLSGGIKGLFFAGLLATIISTSNSLFFLSATTISNDIIPSIKKIKNADIVLMTRFGLLVAAVISFLIAIQFNSIIKIWHVIGSICIPGLIILIFHSYYPKLNCDSKKANRILIFPALVTSLWFYLRENYFSGTTLASVEPMLMGLFCGIVLYLLTGTKKKKG